MFNICLTFVASLPVNERHKVYHHFCLGFRYTSLFFFPIKLDLLFLIAYGRKKTQYDLPFCLFCHAFGIDAMQFVTVIKELLAPSLTNVLYTFYRVFFVHVYKSITSMRFHVKFSSIQ